MNAKNSADNPLPEALRSRRQLAPSDSFSFSCHAGLRCFTRCCADVNVVLAPLDVVRLARRLKLTTREFLDRYGLIPVTKDLHLPVVMLRMGEEPQKLCPFVGEDGCTVYEDRPWSCRMYPVASAIPPARAGVQPGPVFFLMEDSICEGHREKVEWTVEAWRANQEVTRQDDLETGFREIVSHPWFIGGRQLNPKQMELFFMGCYDLDGFRRFVFESSFLERFRLDPPVVDALRMDDRALLAFAFRWLRFALFSEPTMELSDFAKTGGRPARPRKEVSHEQAGQPPR